MRILVVEDETKMANALKKGLTEEGYAVDLSLDGRDALHLVETHSYDLILLDLMIPIVSGLEVLKELRHDGCVAPVLIITAKDAISERVKGLDLGADDYLTKPFSFEELLARIRALFRRSSTTPELQELKVTDLVLDPITRRVRRGDNSIDLSPKEYALLELLMRNPNRVMSRTVLSDHVWGEFDTLTNVIDVYVHYLRDKIDKGYQVKLIHTVRGAGYVLKDEENLPKY